MNQAGMRYVKSEYEYDNKLAFDVSQSVKKYKVISLFSGCGGLDLGFEGGFSINNRKYEENPFEIIFANDIEKHATESYKYNFSNQNVVCQDISTLDVNEFPTADIVIGGFPCQDFSVAGKRRGTTAERGRLYQQMKRVVEYVNPKVFVAENVDGLRTIGKNSDILKQILKEFEEVGYNVEYKVLNAADYGVPQVRKRVIIIGVRNDIKTEIKYPEPVCRQDSWVTAKDAIDDLWDKLDKFPNHSSKDYSRAKFYEGKRTQGNCQIKADKPAPTIRAEHHGNIEGHYRSLDENNTSDMSKWRRLSVRECARLQTFPDSYVFPVCASKAYKEIGNAVPPVLAWHIANSVLDILES